MRVKTVVFKQYQKLVNQAAHAFSEPPPLSAEGWIATVRKALAMPASQLAIRMGVSRPRISELEQSECVGGVTLKSMERAAQAMGCDFVYAIVPRGRIEDVIERQARKKAQEIIYGVSVHMALEDQTVDKANRDERIEDLTRELMVRQTRGFWSDE